MRMRMAIGLAGSLAIAAGSVLPAAQPVAAATTAPAVACSTHWGTGPRAATRAETARTARVAGARAGRHACFERLVIDLGPGSKPGYRVQYVRAVLAEGSGLPVRLRGRAVLDIVVHANAVARFPAAGRDLVSVAGFSVLRQVVSAGSFEGYTEIGVGLRARAAFRVELLAGPGRRSRLIIDVASH